jgi:hypothetical protein
LELEIFFTSCTVSLFSRIAGCDKNVTSVPSWKIVGKLEVRVVGVVDDKKSRKTEVR